MASVIFNAEDYWKLKTYKKWVVRLSSSKTTETRYVSAKSRYGAINAAKAVTFLKGNVICTASLATPKDLGAHCVG